MVLKVNLQVTLTLTKLVQRTKHWSAEVLEVLVLLSSTRTFILD